MLQGDISLALPPQSTSLRDFHNPSQVLLIHNQHPSNKSVMKSKERQHPLKMKGSLRTEPLSNPVKPLLGLENFLGLRKAQKPSTQDRKLGGGDQPALIGG